MNHLCRLSLAVFAAVLIGGCSAQVPAPAAPGPLPEVLQQDAPFQVDIQRTTADSTAARLLRIAELVPPQTDTPTPDSEVTMNWWSTYFDGVRVAQAVTEDAVRYYMQLIEDFGRGDFSGANGIPMQSASFRYHAMIEPHQAYRYAGHGFEDVYVAHLQLQWSNLCGSLCAMQFESERRVVLTREGEVLGVFGDNDPPAVIVS